MKRALFVCPGRGTYQKEALGSLRDQPSAWVDAFDALRSALGRPTVREMDEAAGFRPKLHLAGENASILTAGVSLADLEQVDPDKLEIVGVCGNSMGWYTALAAAGALPVEDAFRLIDTMGAYQTDNVVGGQVVVPCTDEAWHLDRAMRARVDAALAAIQGLHLSIQLGSDVVLGGTEEALAALGGFVPPFERGAFTFPLRLPLHSAFHTPLLQGTRERAEAELGALAWQAPALTLFDGRGQMWRPRATDPDALCAYTLGHQVIEPYDFAKGLRTALYELGPDVIVLPGPGSNLGGAIAQVLIALGWQGIRSKADFLRRQEDDPVLLSMRRPEQRPLCVR